MSVLREDWRAFGPRAVMRPGFHVVAIYRLSRALGDSKARRSKPLRVLRAGVQTAAQTLYGVELPWSAKVGRRLVIGHLGGIVIATDAVIGDDCLIRQNVTIGAAEDGGRSPRIGDRVRIGAGAVLIGDIKVGDDVEIGPNCVVTSDVPAGARVVAAPSRILLLGSGDANAALAPTGQPASPESVAALISVAAGIHPVAGQDTPLLSSGLIDSLNLVVVLQELESAFGVSIPVDAVTAETFDTATQIARYLNSQAE